MSIANEITNYANGLGEAYDAAEDMGAIMPNDKNMNNLDTTIRTIPQPIVNDATLTIQKNGTTVQTFTANQATDATANITVPTKTSDLVNDSGYLSVVDWDDITDKPTFATVATSGSYTDLSNTPNLATVATSGSYTDLSNRPTIGNATLTVQKNGTSVGTFTANATSNKTINIPIPTTAADVSALPDSTKYGASITMSIDNTTYKITTTLKDQDGNTLGSAQEIDLPLESVVVSGSFDSVNKKIVLVLENGSTVDIPVGDLVAGLQTEITASNKLSADLVDDTNATHKFVTAANKTTWNGKQDALTAGNNIQINGTTISATDTTYSTMTGATGSADGAGGLVPKPVAGDNTKYLSGDGTWKTVSEYSLPIASASTLGGIKVGANLTINSSTGVLSGNDPTILKMKADKRASASPSDLDVSQAAAFYFASMNGLDSQTTGNNYADVLVLSGWNDTSGGRVNAIVATKTGDQKLYHYTGTKNGSSWSGKKEIAYADDLATVATSGSYNDLSNKPTIPTVNNATLTIQKNGTTVKTFTANASSNVTANITVPTKTSDITNDSNFPVDASYVHTDNNFTTTLKNKLDGIATGAEVNQNAFSNVKVGSSTIAADSKTDTLEIAAGDNISLAADTTNDKVTITGKNMVYTNNNLAPGEDTPASWQTLFNTSSSTGVGPHSGYFVTWYNTANKFTNQPSQYGFLETFMQGGDIHQRWYTQSGGPERYRSGNASGWNSTYFPNGVFKVIANTGDIPTVNNGQLTIQKNGTNVATFTANQSTAATANITVPTKTSDITNDSNFVTSTDLAGYLPLSGGAMTGAITRSLAASGTIANTNVFTLSGSTDGFKVDYEASTADKGVTKFSTTDDANAVLSLGNTISGTYSSVLEISNKVATFPFVAKFTKNDGTYPHIAGNGSVLAISATGGWAAGSGAISLGPTEFRPSTAETGNINLGASNALWKNLYVSGDLYHNSNKLTLPSAAGTLALTSDIPSISGKVDVDSINLEGQTTTILAQVQALAAANKDYGRFSTDTDGGTSGISDKPTGTTNKGFCCTAYRMRDYGTEDTYYLTCYVRDGSDTNPYVAVVAQNSTSITWKRQQPTVNNATLTIQKNGTNVQTFTANQSTNATANITVPTKVSELTSDAGGNMFIGTCGTAAATAAKAVTVSSDQNFALKVGAIVAVKFTNTNTASTPTINVNSTGAKNIWYNNASYTGTSNWVGGYASKYTYYVYDGTYWCWLSMGSEADSTYSTMSVSEGTTGTATTARTMRADYLKQIIEGIRPIDSTMSESSTNAIQNKVISTKVNQLDRFTRALVPFGTAIAANKDLNTLEFMKVQKFYCSLNATVATLTNCPTNGTAFMMEVFSPLSTTVDNEQSNWCYRTRMITDLNGNMYVQSASSNGSAVWSYGAWKRVAWKSEVDAKPNITMTSTDPGTGSTLAANNYVAVYGDSDGTIQTADIANSAVSTDKLADYSVTRVKFNHLDLVNNGEWVCIGYAHLGTTTDATTAVTVNIPADYRGGKMQYKIVGAYEVPSINGAEKYPRVEVNTGGTWRTNSCFYSCQRVWKSQWGWYGESGGGGYAGTTAIFGHEWNCSSDWDSCTFEFTVSNGYAGSHWTWTGTAGGMSGGHPGTWNGGGRVQDGGDIQAFRLTCSSAIKWGSGAGFAVYARKRNY